MTSIKTAKLLFYNPRSTKYDILYHNIKIKDESGTWSKGCMYVNCDGIDSTYYTRPYAMFDLDKWTIL